MPAVEVDDLADPLRRPRGGGPSVVPAERGRITALLGPNGAGKTSTVETLEGYRRPTGGTVRVLGLDPGADHACSRAAHRGDAAVRAASTPASGRSRCCGSFAGYYDHPADPDELLDRVGLADRRRSTWRTLSGGEQQRLSLALALVGRPRGGLPRRAHRRHRPVRPPADPPASSPNCATEGVAVVLTTHDLDEAEKLADRVVIIDHGRLLADGTPTELMSAGQTDEVRFGAPAGLDVGALATALDAPVTEESPGEYRVGGRPHPGHRGPPHRLAGRARPAPGRPAGRTPDARGRFPPAHPDRGPRSPRPTRAMRGRGRARGRRRRSRR